MSQVAFVTGSSSGLGLALSIELAQAGYRTVATMRDPSRQAARQAATEADAALEVRTTALASEAEIRHVIDLNLTGVIRRTAGFAVAGHTESLASHVQPAFGVRFTAIEPGGISSALCRLETGLDPDGCLLPKQVASAFPGRA